MIFKGRDSSDQQFREVDQALQKSASVEQRRQLERRLAQIRAGVKGEQEAAYHIDFHLKDSKNWAVIHDLRLEWNGRVAQIDHLLLDRLLGVCVVESKSFRSKIRHANGGWERLNFGDWEGIPSPVEQNERHILVLRELVSDHQLAPTRFGLSPTYFNVVVVQPTCSIIGEIPNDARIYRMDSLVKKVKDINPTPLDALKMVSAETLRTFAQKLVAFHKPAPKFTVLTTDWTRPVSATSARAQDCQNCGKLLTVAEVSFCRMKETLFAGKLLCRKCQNARRLSKAPAIASNPNSTATEEALQVAANCAGCGGGVDRKVVAFCRFNSKRFNGQVLCRTCQPSCSQ